MHETLIKVSALLVAIELAAAIACGILSYRESLSLRKGHLRLAATILFGSIFCFLGIGQFFLLRSLPILNAEGIIKTAAVHSEGKDYRTDFTVLGPDGMTYHLNADGRNDLFRQGEHVFLTYYGYTGSVIKAHFISAAGSEEGVFNSLPGIRIVIQILLGAFFCWAGYKKFQRDPHDAEIRRR